MAAFLSDCFSHHLWLYNIEKILVPLYKHRVTITINLNAIYAYKIILSRSCRQCLVKSQSVPAYLLAEDLDINLYDRLRHVASASSITHQI